MQIGLIFFFILFFLNNLVHYISEKVIIVIFVLFLFFLMYFASSLIAAEFKARVESILSEINAYMDALFNFYYMDKALFLVLLTFTVDILNVRLLLVSRLRSFNFFRTTAEKKLKFFSSWL